MTQRRTGGRTGGRILIDGLLGHGIDTIFCVPGESYLAALDAIHEVGDRIALITCRQEGGAAFMAEAHAKLTGRPAAVFVTRGPGACNASIGLHTAFQDSTPLLLLVGQIARGHLGREAFQEIDQEAFLGPVTKYVARIDDPARLPEFLGRAVHAARSGRPGPAALVLPEDMLRQEAEVADCQPVPVAAPAPDPQAIADLGRRLAKARQPLVIAGGGGWSEAARAGLAEFADAHGLPVACAFRRQHIVDADAAHYVGDLGLGLNPELAALVKNADLLLVIGSRLGDVPTRGYTLLEVPRSAQSLVHVHPSADELGRVYRPDLAIVATPDLFLAAAAGLQPAAVAARAGWAQRAREAYLEDRGRVPCPGPLDLWQVMREIDERLPADAIVTTGAGNYAGWVTRFLRFGGGRHLVAPTNGAMGYGVPAAIAACAAAPDRTVLGFAGDGCFLMNGQELATAVQYGFRPVFIVVNNGSYGTIRAHQELNYPGRVCGTDLVNPDFAALARSYGLDGQRVDRTADFAPAFARALGAGRAALIELVIPVEAISTRASLSDLRARASP